MKNVMKLLKKKMSEITIKEFLQLTDKRGVYYEDITNKCVFKPHCVGGSNSKKYGINTTYYDLGIYYKNELLFKMNVSSFIEKSIMPEIFGENRHGEEFEFNWLDNGSFMIVKVIEVQQ